MLAFRAPLLMRFMLLLFAVALLPRVGIAPGMMAEATPDGTITLSVCGSAGLMPTKITVPIDRDTPAPALPKAEESCPYATLAMAADVPPAPVIPPLRVAAPQTPTEAPATPLALGAASPLPPATGPPVHV